MTRKLPKQIHWLAGSIATRNLGINAKWRVVQKYCGNVPKLKLPWPVRPHHDTGSPEHYFRVFKQCPKEEFKAEGKLESGITECFLVLKKKKKSNK